MRGRSICLYEEIWKIIWYLFLSGALISTLYLLTTFDYMREYMYNINPCKYFILNYLPYLFGYKTDIFVPLE